MVFAESFNLARRLSNKNEPDFLQDDLFGKFMLRNYNENTVKMVKIEQKISRKCGYPKVCRINKELL